MVEWVLNREMADRSDDEEISIVMNSSPDQKTVTLVIEAQTPIDLPDLILTLESYLTDLIRASQAKPDLDDSLH